MSKQLINKYRKKIHDIVQFSGSRNEGVEIVTRISALNENLESLQQ